MHDHCGGIAINKNWILTSAHCINFPFKPHENYFLVTGTTRAEEVEYDFSLPNTYSIDDFLPHPHSNRTCPAIYGKEMYLFDLALIYVAEGFEFNDNFQPAKLSKKDDKLKIGQIVTVAGFGPSRSSDPKKLNDLKLLETKIFDPRSCEIKIDRKPLNPCENPGIAYCTKKLMGSVCPEDSGAPLFITNSNGEEIVYGINIGSRSAECETVENYNYFASISHNLNWIKEHVDLPSY